MTKQTAKNNEFLSNVKKVYNEKIFKKASLYVNEGKQDLAKFMLDTQLFFYVDGEKVAQKLIEMGYNPTKDQSIEELFQIAGFID